jgi:hypothetical protein
MISQCIGFKFESNVIAVFKSKYDNAHKTRVQPSNYESLKTFKTPLNKKAAPKIGAAFIINQPKNLAFNFTSVNSEYRIQRTKAYEAR